MRYSDLAALVVHVRPYRETSAMVQFFTREHGRLVGVMKGLHRGRRQQLVQPFQAGRLSCAGKSGLVTVTQFDTSERFMLEADGLSAGFYVLELLTRCLAEHQAEPRVFDATLAVLAALTQNAALAPTLRRFEQTLLHELGYGYDLRHALDSDQTGHMAVAPDAHYRLVDEVGFVRTLSTPGSASKAGLDVIPGWVLLALADRDYSGAQVLYTAKLLNQHALKPLLGPAPLISRTMYTGTPRG